MSQKRGEDFLRSIFRSSLLEAADLPAQLGFRQSVTACHMQRLHLANQEGSVNKRTSPTLDQQRLVTTVTKASRKTTR